MSRLSTIEAIVTNHGYERAEQRLGLTKEQADRKIRNVLAKGRDYTKFTSKEKQYLRSQERKGARAFAYDGFCYIIADDNVCITTYRLPSWFGKSRNYDGKTKIKNLKKYNQNYKYHCFEGEY